MAKNFRQVGKSITISGVSGTTVASGSLYRRTGGSQFQRAWIGVVTDRIIGDDQSQETLDRRPIDIGDGVAAEAQLGEGKGDMMIEGVHVFRLPTSGMAVADSDPLYGDFNSTTNVASGVTDNGAFGPISGALVGFAVGANYTATTAPFTGLNVVDVKLLGLPLHGLEAISPAE